MLLEDGQCDLGQQPLRGLPEGVDARSLELREDGEGTAEMT